MKIWSLLSALYLLLVLAFTSCKTSSTHKSTASELSEKTDVQKQLTSETSCIENTFKAIAEFSDRHLGSQEGFLHVDELYKIDLSECPNEFRNAFISLIDTLVYYKELRVARNSLENGGTLDDPDLLSVLKRVAKPEDSPVADRPIVVAKLNEAIAQHKKELSNILTKLVAIASEYSVKLEE